MHNNALGYKKIANVIYKVLNDFMLSNFDKFEQIEFIGIDYEW